MPKNNTEGIDFQEAARQAAAELAEAEASEGPASSSGADDNAPAVEQPSVENREDGLFKGLRQQGEQSNANSQTVEVNGEQLTISQLRDGYLRQADYTQKTQDLAKEKAELEKARTLWQALQENPSDTVRQLYQRVNQGLPVAEQPTTQAKSEADDIEALIERKVQERLAADPNLQSMQRESALSRANLIFDELASDYGVTITDADKSEVLQRSIRDGNQDIRATFALMMHERQKWLAQQENAVRTSTASGRRTDIFDATAEEPQLFSSFKDAWKLTLVEEGVDSLFD